MNPFQFFPPDTDVLALPSWRRPRLLYSANSLSLRWRGARLYPAFRASARAYRGALRLKAVLSIFGTKCSDSSGQVFWNFIQEHVPDATSVGVLFGTPGPAQKTTLQLRDEQGDVVAYLKYGEKPAAQRRLRNEFEVLRALPGGTGPSPLRLASVSSGMALLMRPCPGTLIRASLSPPKALVTFLSNLTRTRDLSIDSHPWVIRLSEDETSMVEPILAELSGTRWPVVFQHGDFAPWNLLQDDRGSLAAIDWEYGYAEGFPHIDLGYYFLQVGALIYRWSPKRAAQNATRLLCQRVPALSHRQAKALVQLSALHAYREAIADGQSHKTMAQSWRLGVISGAW